MGHTIVLLWTVVRRIPGLWIIPVDIIPQEDCHPCLIYDYTWIGLNATVLRKDPPMAMQFRWALMRLLCHILHLDPALRPVFLSKVDLSDMYMRVWVCLEYIPHLLFVVPPTHPSPKPSSDSTSPYQWFAPTAPPTYAALAIPSQILSMPDGGDVPPLLLTTSTQSQHHRSILPTT